VAIVHTKPTSCTLNGWANCSLAYDEDNNTGASISASSGSWTPFIEFNFTPMYCAKIGVRYFNSISGIGSHTIDIDTYYGDAWHNLFQNLLPQNLTLEPSFSTQLISKFRIRLYYTSGSYPTSTVYVSEVYSFARAPSVTTGEASDITGESATLNGTIDYINGDNAIKRGFYYSKDPNIVKDVKQIYEEGDYGIGAFSLPVTGLDKGDTYYFKAFATNDVGEGTGDIEYFETEEVAVTVTTNAASEISYDCAMGNGTIESDTNATERGFEIKLDFSGTLENSIQHSIAGFEGDVDYNLDNHAWEGTLTKTETDTGDFEEGDYELVLGYPSVLGNPSAVFSDKLFKCEDYEYRAYAVIDEETYYGEWVEFSTLCDEGGDQQPDDNISDADPTEPPIPPPEEPEEYPPFEWEPEPPEPYPPWDWDIPPWEYPDFPPLSFVGDFYYRKPYTQKDLDDLRRKCIIYNKNSIEFALVLRHNMNVLREFFNMMTDYLEADEFNDFTDLVPPQRLKELYLDPLEPVDFRDMINGFIRNTIDNNIAVNRNFSLIQEGLSDYETDDDASFREITSNIKILEQDNPDVHRMKRLIDDLNFEVSASFNDIMYNLEVIRARLL
jgi:hypothetical protein